MAGEGISGGRTGGPDEGAAEEPSGAGARGEGPGEGAGGEGAAGEVRPGGGTSDEGASRDGSPVSGSPADGARPTGSPGQRARAWLRRHRKGAWAVVGVVVVLGVGAGLLQSPAGQDWWLARKACGGKLPRGELETLKSGRYLEREKELANRELGQYICRLGIGEADSVVSVEAFTRARDQRRILGRVNDRMPPHELLPDTLPGFTEDDQTIHLMPSCPKLGTDTAGRPRRMLVTTRTPMARSRAERAALLRTAVTMTNRASEKLGCSDRQLAVPSGDTGPHEGEEVPLDKVSGTPCAAMARVPLGKGTEGAEVRVQVSERTPVARCSLSVAGKGGRQGVLELIAWYGNWGAELHGTGLDRRGRNEDGDATPVWDATRAWATARCGGEAASFDANWYTDETLDEALDERALRRALPRTGQGRAAVLRDVVSRFARDEAGRRGCDRPDLPGAADRLPD
ncbi:hypothetical protein [Streptomyces sp. NRRL F-5053]|uniref:hypothetical protein n=1 Tax=Streptomyces sp. NRRL F-5053 TaxID=1463854 RepID=UPI000A4A4149|nr:hypothetical protein [Streptomyces sp. NRRL F-5053]